MRSGDDKSPRRAKSRPLRAAARLVRLIAICVRCGVSLAFLRWRESDERRRLEGIRPIMHRSFEDIQRALGFRIHVRGLAPPDGALLAPNHTGYGDILALGACLPCFFVPKAEILGWPGIGALVRLSGHVASSRRAARNLRGTAEAVARRLAMGHNVVVFLEGTSTGGDRVLPFRSSFVQPAIDAGSPIVPVGIRWFADDPQVDPSEEIAYWKDHAFAAHFWRFLGLRGVWVEISFGPARFLESRADRKEVARALCDDVREMCLPRPEEGSAPQCPHCTRIPGEVHAIQ